MAVQCSIPLRTRFVDVHPRYVGLPEIGNDDAAIGSCLRDDATREGERILRGLID